MIKKEFRTVDKVKENDQQQKTVGEIKQFDQKKFKTVGKVGIITRYTMCKRLVSSIQWHQNTPTNDRYKPSYIKFCFLKWKLKLESWNMKKYETGECWRLLTTVFVILNSIFFRTHCFSLIPLYHLSLSLSLSLSPLSLSLSPLTHSLSLILFLSISPFRFLFSSQYRLI